MGRLKTLVNLVILAIAAGIVWLEYQRAAERRTQGPGSGGSSPRPADATPGGASQLQEPLAGAMEMIRNVAAQVATAATEITGLGPAETASETAEADTTSVASSGAGRPAEPAATATAATAQADDPTLPANAVRGDGTNVCPEAYPIKGNASSMIYHVPGRSTYDRTIPEFCFATIEAAEAVGFRAPLH